MTARCDECEPVRAGRVPAVRVCGLTVLLLVLGLAGCDDPSRRSEATPEPPAAVTPLQAEQIAALEALGYAEGDRPADDGAGVRIHDRSRAQPGVNLFTSEHEPAAHLMDMDGRVLHTWRIEPLEPDRATHLRRVRLLEDGGLLVLLEKQGMARIDRDGRVLWTYRDTCHHDFDVAEDGTIWVLTREAGVFPAQHPTEPILDEHVTVLGPDGSLRSRSSILEAFERSHCCRDVLPRGESGDVFHDNALVLLDGGLVDRHPAFRAGNVLLSWRHRSTVGIFDPRSEAIVWTLSGSFQRQHDPRPLPNGNLLIFDNDDVARGDEASRVIEVDPTDGSVAWEFHSTPEFPFWTRSGGANARLPNGNTLITETRGGRAFEVTSGGDVVWEFVHAGRLGRRGRKMARLFELQRIPERSRFGWLGDVEAGVR